MDLGFLLGAIAAFIGLVSYIPYILDCAAKKTKPHLFSWIIWSILQIIAIFAQLVAGAGPTIFVYVMAFLVNLVVIYFALKNPDKNITLIDIVCFVLAIVSIIAWQLTTDPFFALVFVILADGLGFFVTFRKTFKRPNEETLTAYAFAAIKHFVSIFALSSVTITTLIYPVYLVLINVTFVLMAIIRRKQLSAKKV